VPTIRRTITGPDLKEPVVAEFDLPAISQRTVGVGVTGKVIYDLKKGRVSQVDFIDGSSIRFEVVKK